MIHSGIAKSRGVSRVIQIDVYRLDRRLDRSFQTDRASLYDTLCRMAGKQIDSLADHVLGEVSVLRVDLGRNGFAVLEHV